jgi:hypothetical protein
MSKQVEVDALPACDICAMVGDTHEAQYDGKTTAGPWANMCDEHFAIHGIGLGTGLGQRLVVRDA